MLWLSTILVKSVGTISNFSPPPTQCWSIEIKSQNFWTFQQNNSLSGTNIEWGEGGFIFFSWYRVFAVFLKKCLSSDNYRRTSQLLLTRIVGKTRVYFVLHILPQVFAVFVTFLFCFCFFDLICVHGVVVQPPKRTSRTTDIDVWKCCARL